MVTLKRVFPPRGALTVNMSIVNKHRPFPFIIKLGDAADDSHLVGDGGEEIQGIFGDDGDTLVIIVIFLNSTVFTCQQG